MSYTRAKLCAAVDEAHAAIHQAMQAWTRDHDTMAGGCIERAHEALHRVGAGLPRVECGTMDPELQVVVEHYRNAADTTILPGCGHRFSDLIAGPGTVTKCGACLAERMHGAAPAADTLSPPAMGEEESGR